MFRDFFRAFAELFTERRSKLEISGLLVTMALLPVSELAVTHMFSKLVLDGKDTYENDPGGLVAKGSIFFLAFALSRAIHHIVRLNRVRVFRRGFDSSGHERAASAEAWSWAAAFELSTVMVSLIQVGAFCLMFVYFDLVFGLANIVIAALVLWLITRIYHRQLVNQTAYLLEGHKPGSTAIGDRVGSRIRDAELGAVVASLAMAFSLAAVLYRAVEGGISSASAIVLFIGLRMLYSQVGNLSASAMRFARVKARLAAGQKGVDVVDPDDEFDIDEEVEDLEELQPAQPTAHRTKMVAQMMMASQRGEVEEVLTIGERLGAKVIPMEAETAAIGAAEAYARFAHATDDRLPLTLMWWPRPFPGTVGNWLSPMILRGIADRAVTFQRPGVDTQDAHLVMLGSIASSIQASSIVVGTGALNADVAIVAEASYLSVRGPLTAEVLRRAGGPAVTTFGDPALLTSRFIPIDRTAPHGRLALVRHLSHAEIPVSLPEHVDEISTMASTPQAIKEFVRSLAAYDGVVTSDSSTTAICHSYGIPCAPIVFEGHHELDFVFADYARGAGLDDLEPLVVGPDLAQVTWDDVLVTRTVDGALLDEIQSTVTSGVTQYLDRLDTAGLGLV